MAIVRMQTTWRSWFVALVALGGTPFMHLSSADPPVQDWNGEETGGSIGPVGPGVWINYTIYKPGIAPGALWSASATNRLPVVFVLHGALSNGGIFADLTDMNLTADANGFYVVYPSEDDTNDGGCKCWRWYLESEQDRSGLRATMLKDIAGRVTGTHHQAAGVYGDPAKVYATGLSAGGAMAAILGAVYPDVFSKVAPASGVQFGGAKCPNPINCDAVTAMQTGGRDSNVTGHEAFTQMEGHGPPRVPVMVFHGEADQVVRPVNARNITTSFAQANDYLDGPTGSPDNDSVDWLWDGCQHYLFLNPAKNYRRMWYQDNTTDVLMERWMVDAMGHMWSGSNPSWPESQAVSYPLGPNQSAETWRFFSQGPGQPQGPAEPGCQDV